MDISRLVSMVVAYGALFLLYGIAALVILGIAWEVAVWLFRPTYYTWFHQARGKPFVYQFHVRTPEYNDLGKSTMELSWPITWAIVFSSEKLDFMQREAVIAQRYWQYAGADVKIVKIGRWNYYGRTPRTTDESLIRHRGAPPSWQTSGESPRLSQPNVRP